MKTILAILLVTLTI